MSAEISVYEGAGFGSVRAFEDGGEVWFVAADVAKALGYRDAADMTRTLDGDEKGYATMRTPGGDQRVSTINEYGLYRACVARKVGHIRDDAMRANVERFQRWITHEVIPSIRRHGAYVNPAGAETDEELIARALEAARAVIARREERIRALESENEAMRPKAELGEAVSGSGDSILVGDLARLLRQNGCRWAGRTRLFQRLRGDGYLNSSKSGEKNAPNQRYLEMGLFEVSQRTFQRGDRVETAFTTRVTPKGQAYFLKRYAGVGGDAR